MTPSDYLSMKSAMLMLITKRDDYLANRSALSADRQDSIWLKKPPDRIIPA